MQSFCSFAVFCYVQNSYECLSSVWFLSLSKYFWKCTVKGRVTMDDNELVFVYRTSPNRPVLIIYVLSYKLLASSFCPFCHPFSSLLFLATAAVDFFYTYISKLMSSSAPESTHWRLFGRVTVEQLSIFVGTLSENCLSWWSLKLVLKSSFLSFWQDSDIFLQFCVTSAELRD